MLQDVGSSARGPGSGPAAVAAARWHWQHFD